MKEKIAKAFVLPQEVTLNISKITLLGNRELLLENHQGLQEYTEGLIRVRVSEGQILIHGHGLMITRLDMDEIRVKGRFLGLEFSYLVRGR